MFEIDINENHTEVPDIRGSNQLAELELIHRSTPTRLHSLSVPVYCIEYPTQKSPVRITEDSHRGSIPDPIPIMRKCSQRLLGCPSS
jgi:hypothetical protein